MVLTPSIMLPLGTTAPDFSLPDTVSGTTKTLTELKSDQATVIMFICNHCPFVIHINPELVRLANEYQSQGVSFIAISANDAEAYPQDDPEQMTKHAAAVGYPFPYLYDESQEVAAAYQAKCTPDLFVFDGDMRLAYRGQLDDSRPGNDKPLNGQDLRAALDSILAGEQPSEDQKPSIGCNIKWKS